tara:strand:+ start:150 stop:968 length:819 start_codon:yes stop_codon:yes gene_type:complete
MKTDLKNQFAFKGGTCITKCYLGYYRFSEDLDFTYINQKEFKGKSQKAIRRILSTKINTTLLIFEKIAKDLNLDFKKDKGNKKYFEFGGSNKFTTFKLWYTSEILKEKQFIKIQINFVEIIEDKIIDNSAKSLYQKINKKEMQLLHPSYIDIIKEIPLKTYTLNEILYEKIRAILTRREIKARDFIDVYLINKKLKLNFLKEEKKIIKKITFMLKYDKYLQNLSVIKPKEIVLDDVEKLLLKPVDKGFEKFMISFCAYLEDLKGKLQKVVEL